MAAPSTRRPYRSPILWAVLLTALYLLALATEVSPFLFGNDEWGWHHRPPSPVTCPRWWPAITVMALYLLVVVLWMENRGADRPSHRREWVALAFLVLMAPAIQVALKYIHYRYPIEFYLYRTIGPHNGFWQIAIGTDDLVHYLRTYPEQMRAYPFVHTAVHPPGDIIYIWLWRKGLEHLPGLAHTVAQFFRAYNCADLQFVRLNDAQISSALAQMTIPLLSGWSAIPIYLLGKRLAGPRTGFRAAALYVVLPSLTLFTMRWDQLYPLFMALALYWLHVGLEERRPVSFFLAGLAVSLSSFMSLGNLTILLLLGVYGLAHLVCAGILHWREWLRRTWTGWLLLALGSASVWLCYQVLFGPSFLDVLNRILETHFHLGRSYWLWVGYNLYDFAAFLGIPVAVVFVAESIRAWRGVTWRGVAMPRQAIPALSVGLALLALDISGVSRGEVGRMWLPWMSGACLVAATGLSRRPRRADYWLILTLLALQSIFFTLFLRVSATGMPSFRPHHPVTNAPHPAYRLEARLGRSIELVGYDLEPEEPVPGGTLHLTLYWRAVARPASPYTVFTHLLGEGETLVGQQDNMPVQDTLPTTCWQPGEFVADPYDIPVAADAEPGVYVLEVGMYDLLTGERLPVSGPPGQPADRLLLRPVRLASP